MKVLVRSKKDKSRKKLNLPDDINIEKTPVYLGSHNLDGRYLSWRFSSADINGPFSCGQLDHDDFTHLWERLRAFERMNLSQFRKAQSFHGVPCVNISKKAKKRLEEINKDDLDIIYSFRVMGECRLWCMKHENILSVLWWDRYHEVYPVEKRYTYVSPFYSTVFRISIIVSLYVSRVIFLILVSQSQQLLFRTSLNKNTSFADRYDIIKLAKR